MSSAEASPDRPSSSAPWGPALMLAGLAVVTAVTFLPSLGNGFLVYDDSRYVTENPVVQRGLTTESLGWALTTRHTGYWHPVTWISHMVDVELFGIHPRGHHFTSLVLHVANVLLLFLVLRGLTGATGRSAAVAALFALHPTRTESVAWVAERKDVLSALFWILTMGAYGAWVRRRGSGRYLLALGLFALGLMAKPMLVSLPLVLLLLDVWPLRRLSPGAPATGLRALVWEKLPFFALAGASAVVTVLNQRAEGALGTLPGYPLGTRAANALVATAQYLRTLVWPSGLAVFYPYPAAPLPAGQVAGAAALLVVLSLVALRARRAQPALLVGWLWFLLTLLPVIGLLQAGEQARADRYTYMPYVGLFIAVVWGGWSRASRLRHGKVVAAAALTLALGAFAAATRSEIGHWRDSETLFTRALAVTRDNAVAHYSLGHYFLAQGKIDEAIPHFREALRISPAHAQALHSLGRALVLKGRFDEAAPLYEAAVRLDPHDAGAMNNLALCFLRQGDVNQALHWYGSAAEEAPNLPHLQHVQGMLLLVTGRTGAAVPCLERAVALDPSRTEWSQDLEGARDLAAGRPGPAVERLHERLAAYPPRPSSEARSTSDSRSPALPARPGGRGPAAASPPP